MDQLHPLKLELVFSFDGFEPTVILYRQYTPEKRLNLKYQDVPRYAKMRVTDKEKMLMELGGDNTYHKVLLAQVLEATTLMSGECHYDLPQSQIHLSQMEESGQVRFPV